MGPVDNTPSKPVTALGQQPEKHITSPEDRKIFTGVASDIGFFSGRIKKRLELSNDELDPTHKFAIALFEEAVDTTTSNYKLPEKGVYVHLRTDKQGALMTDVADISSIAKRLNLSEGKVRELAARTTNTQGYTALDTEIQKIVDEYEQKVSEIKDFLKALSQEKKLNEIKDALTRFGDVIKIENNDQNKELKILLKNFCDENASTEKISEFKFKLNEFVAKLSEMDMNFNPNIAPPPEKITKDTTIWGNVTPNLLFDCVAEGFKIPEISRNNKGSVEISVSKEISQGKAAVRLNISPYKNAVHQYAIQTDGFIYHEKPKSSGKFIPYSRDGKTWVLLNINSLSNRLDVSVEDLKSALKQVNLEQFVEQKRAYLPGEHLKDLISEFSQFAEGIKNSNKDLHYKFQASFEKIDMYNLYLSKNPEKVNPGLIYSVLKTVMNDFKALQKEDLFKLFGSHLDASPKLKERFLLERGEEALTLALTVGCKDTDESTECKNYESTECKNYLLESKLNTDKIVINSIIKDAPHIGDIVKDKRFKLSNCDSTGRTPLHIALLVFSRYPYNNSILSCINQLISHEATVKKDLLENLLKENNLGETLLFRANLFENRFNKKSTATNKNSIVNFLLDNGVDVNSKNEYGMTLHDMALLDGDTDRCMTLIAKGANPSTTDVAHLLKSDNLGRTLYSAAILGEPATPKRNLPPSGKTKNFLNEIDFLTKNGIDINTKNKDGINPLHEALLYSISVSGIDVFFETPFALLLIAKGAILDKKILTDLLKTNQTGEKLLIGAIMNSSNFKKLSPPLEIFGTIKFLLDNGADKYLQDKDGHNLLHYAYAHDPENNDLIEFLKKDLKITNKKNKNNQNPDEYHTAIAKTPSNKPSPLVSYMPVEVIINSYLRE